MQSTGAVHWNVLMDIDGVSLDVIANGGKILFDHFHHGVALNDQFFVVGQFLSHLLLQAGDILLQFQEVS